MRRTVIGLDVGHSAVKAVAYSPLGRAQVIFPTFVTPAIPITGDPNEKAKCDAETVVIGERSWFFGESARAQGRMKDVVGLNTGWIETDEYRALMLGAIKKLAEHRPVAVPGLEDALIVVGLPADSYGERKEHLKKIVTDLFKGCEAMAQQQPAGALWAHILHDNGAPLRDYNLAEQRWGVVEIGHFTTDFLLMSLGRFIEKPSGSKLGVSEAVDFLVRKLHERGIPATHQIAMTAMKHNRIIVRGESVDIGAEVEAAKSLIAEHVISEARTRLGEEVDLFDGVVIAGGGAPLVIDRLHEMGWTHAQIANSPPSEPRFAVAEGFARYGRGILLIEQQQERKRA